MSAAGWSSQLPVKQLRFARPTSRLEAATHFYRDCLGLEELYRFEDHAGYDGLMLGLPGTQYHLELTQHAAIDGTASTRENLLVLYLGTSEAVARVVARFTGGGYQPVEAENPFWATQGAVTFEDPDGWLLVLVPRPGL
jgi:catechol 2,3-dioxygenase-like lactoylglutathione lyase family enzyme